MNLCFLIPASPTDGFLGQIAMFRRSLDALGGVYRDAMVIAVFGDAEVQSIPDRWQSSLEGVQVQHVPRDAFLEHGYQAQISARWEVLPDDADLAVFVDADVMMIRPIDDLLRELAQQPSIAGSIAHYPMPQPPDGNAERQWQELFRILLGRDAPLDYRYSLLRDEDEARCPFYVNFGFVGVPRDLVEPVGAAYRSLVPRVAPYLRDPYFAGQVALTLAIYELDVPHRALDLRYNFPNDPLAESLHPGQLADARVIHYLRTTRFDRQSIFASESAIELFLSLGLSGSDRLLQQHVQKLVHEPPPLPVQARVP